MTNKVLIFIPTFNDFSLIESLTTDIKNKISVSDILIIDDGSTIDYKPQSHYYYVRIPFNLGLGVATHIAMDFMLLHDYKFLIRLDSDGQHDSKYINSFISSLESGADFVVGNRTNRYDGTGFKLVLKKMVHYYFYILAKLTTRYKIPTDLNSGFLGFSRKAVSILNRIELERYPEPQLVLFSAEFGLKIATIDILQKARQKGRSTIAYWQTLQLLFRFTVYNFIILIRKKIL